MNWRILAAVAALVLYALASHGLMVHAAQAPWAVAVLFGPLVLAVAAAGWQKKQTSVLVACAAGVALLVAVVARGGVEDINRMYVLQHAGIHLTLAFSFASTLRAGSTPLITALAETVHLNFTPEMRAYTRWLTGAWAVYFVAMVVFSLALYALAPWPWWSAYCNLATPLCAGLFFVGEHVQRYRRHPHFERVTLRNAIAAYRKQGSAS